jgi:amino acid adenylation domain-containing protein
MDKTNIEAILTLSPAQQGMLFYLLLAQGKTGRSDAFLEQQGLHLRGAVDPAALEAAWQKVFERHSALRTCFVWERREKPIQVVLREASPKIDFEDRRGENLDPEATLQALLAEELARGLDLNKAPLTRLRLVQVADQHFVFTWTFSHLLLDGWSISRVISEVFELYFAATHGEKLELPAARPFRDYIQWLQNQDLGAAERHWRKALEGVDGATSLAIDHGAGRRMSEREARLDKVGNLSRKVDPATTSRILELARSGSLTTNSVVQAAFSVLLGLYAGREDVVYGSVVSGRPPVLDGVESMIGMFINALPVRSKLDPGKTFLEFARELQLQLVHQREYEYCPLEQIQRWIGLPHDTPLFEMLVAFENYPPADARIGELKIEGALREVSNYPLLVYFVVSPTELRISTVFDQERYESAEVSHLLDRLVDLIGRLVENPNIKLGEIRLLSPEAERGTAALLAGPVSDWPRESTFPELFAAVAGVNPGKPAVEQVGSAETLSYGELDRASTRLAHLLRRAGVGPDQLVAISLERSPAAIVALLAVQKAGGAVLPIDPQYPEDRIRHMLEDSGARFLITRFGLASRFPAGPRAAGPKVFTFDGPAAEIALEESEEAFASGLEPHHLAYVIYTSGSTGKPKGVAVEQRNLVHYAFDAAETYRIAADDRLLQFATLSFDTSAEEIYPALLKGATLVLRDEEMIASPATFFGVLASERISVLNLPTAYWHELCADLGDGSAVALPAELRLAIIGGEAALAERLDRWQKSVAAASRPVVLWNTYGPTETTIVATRFDLSHWRPADHNTDVPIGGPIADLNAYVVDSELRLLPPGLPGELCIGGAGVARGYLGQPELTEERFRADRFAGTEGERFYRTGDKVVATADGNLLFRGRVDQQVKIRGFRVEPGEIESALLALGGLREVSVVARPDGHGQLRLVAYLVPADAAAATGSGELRRKLAASLPEYMVPSAFMQLASLPKTPSGKVDRRALPEPEPEDAGVHGRYVPPRTPMEELVAEVWQELLGRPQIGVHEDFFQLGGHSLLVGRVTTRLRSMLSIEIPITTVFEYPTVDQLATRLEDIQAGRTTGSGVELPPIVALPRDGRPMPLSYPQERVWFIQQLELSTVAYNFQTTIWFQGPLDVKALEDTLTEIVRRHEIFWTRFPEVDGRPAMVLEAPWKVELPITDLRYLPEEERPAVAEALVTAETAKAFDVTEIPLIRWKLVQTFDDVYMLIQVEHHFVHDGWSFGVLLREIKAIYEAYSAGEPSPLPELEVQYADFAAWQRKYISGEVVGGLVDFWKKKLEGMPTVLDLPLDHPRPNRPSTRGEAEFFLLPDQLYAGLREFSRAQGVTLYMSMLAAFYALLYRYTGQGDIGVGAGVANRRQKVQEALIGMTVNTIVLRNTFDGETTFAELLKRTRTSALASYSHQDMPFEQLVAALQPDRHVGRNPIVQVLFSFHDASTPTLDFGGMKVGYLVRTNRSAKADLNIIVAPKGEQLVGQKNQALGADDKPIHAAVTWEYNRELFEPETIEKMVRHYLALAADAIKNPGKKISELAMIEPEEVAALHAAAINPPGSPRHASLAALFERQAAATPDAVAAEHGDATLTYRELDRRANQLAHLLRAQGVRPGSLVGLAAHRGLDLPLGMLGILKAGGAYVPLDPAYPAERLALMIGDTKMQVVVAHPELAEKLPAELSQIELRDGALDSAADTPLNLQVDGDFPAYVIFTSGSTGKPKGVLVPQKAVARLVLGTDFYQAGPDDRIGQVANASFDAATFEIWAPLLNGGRVVIIGKDELLTPEVFEAAIEKKGVTAMFLTAAYFQQVVEARPTLAPRLRRLLFGGERCEPEAARKALQAGARGLMNGYGPTECTTFAVCHLLESLAADATSVPIGRPIAGTDAYVLDRDLRLLPAGVHGELCLGGEGLADGYYGRPALTAEKFVPHPFATEPGQRLYKTGDLARILPGGEIDCLGRLDRQVKLRGFRIELGEIEAALSVHPAVAGAVVLLRQDTPGDPRLVAYAVLPVPGTDPSARAEAVPTASELLDYLRGRLPEFMVPSALVILDKMPLDANGKIDRRALPAPSAAEIAEEGSTFARTPAEEVLAQIWAQLLTPQDPRPMELDIRSSFFELGGHSLLGMQLVARLRDQLGIEVPLARLFEAETIEQQAALVEAAMAPGAAVAPPLRATAGDKWAPRPLSFAQERLFFLFRFDPRSPVYNVPGALYLKGALDRAALERAFEMLEERQEVLRTRFVELPEGPRQILLPTCKVEIPVRHIGESQLADLLLHLAARPFDLLEEKPWRAELIELGPEEQVLFYNIHHIVFDGLSIAVFERELKAFYAAALRGEAAELPPLLVSYADYAEWQRSWLEGDALETQLEFWKKSIDPRPLELPTDRPRPATPSFRGDSASRKLGAGLVKKLEEFGRERGATPFVTFLAALKVLLGRLSGQTTVNVGAPISGRRHSEAEGLLGFFINTLVLGTRLEDDPSFEQLLKRVRQHFFEAFAHQDVPFEKLVEELDPIRDTSRNPLFQVGFQVFEGSLGSRQAEFAGLEAQALDPQLRSAKFDLNLTLLRTEGGAIVADARFAQDLYDPATIERWLELYELLLSSLLAAPQSPISSVALERPEDRRMLAALNAAHLGEYPRDASLASLFARQAAATPDAVALGHRGRELTYRQLDQASSRIARVLRSRGVTLGSQVGLAFERGLDLTVAILAVIKAGGAYVPLDADYPAERILQMVADTAMELAIGGEAQLARLPDRGIHKLPYGELAEAAAELDGSAAPADLADGGSPAYTIFTSGSTGRPKGVAVPQRAISRLVIAPSYSSFAPGEVVAQVSSASFDAFTFEYWGSLLNGARLEIFDREVLLEPAKIKAAFHQHRVATTFLTATLFHQILQAEPDAFALVKNLHFGGERSDPSQVRRALQHPPRRLVNSYGPTESTTFATTYEVDQQAELGRSVPIGKPIGFTGVLVLDRAGQPAAIGSPGELCLSGDGLAYGYWRQAARTAEAFVPHPRPSAPGERIYRTGDLVRLLPSGDIDYLGRIDHQVKIRGYRIELGEIETLLGRQPAVRESVVVVQGEGANQRLIGFVALEPEYLEKANETLAAIDGALAEVLPFFSLPQLYRLDALPLDPNGKVDRRALPKLDALQLAGQGDDGGAERVAPRNDLEATVAAVFAELLGEADFGIEADFFELGGHSLLATRLVSRLREATGVDLALRDVFESSTVEGLAALLAAAAPGDAEPALERGNELEGPLSFGQQRIWFLQQFDPATTAYNMPWSVEIEGPVDAGLLDEALRELVSRHEILRTTYPFREGEVTQVVGHVPEKVLAVVNLGSTDAVGSDPIGIREALAKETHRIFDLEKGPALRATLFRLGDEHHVLLLDCHHVTADGWSFGVLWSDLTAIYRSLQDEEHESPPAPPFRYLDFARWQRQLLQGEALESRLAFWRERLAGSVALELPLDKKRPSSFTYRGARHVFELDAELTGRLRETAKAGGATLYMTLLAGLAALLHRWSGQERFNVGTPTAGRSRPEFEAMAGLFVNTLVVPLDLSSRPSFEELLGRTRSAVLEAFAHQDVPFERLAAELEPERDPSRNPLFQVGFQVLDRGFEPAPWPDGRARQVLPDLDSAKFDLDFYVVDRGETLTGSLVYSSDLFLAETVERLFASWRELLQAATAAPATRVDLLPAMAESEASRVAELAALTPEAGAGASVLPAILRMATRHPDRRALVFGSHSLTYGELALRIDDLAAQLVARGLGPGKIAGVLLERSLDLPVALLAVWRAGAAYLPLDPSFPKERLELMLEMAGADLLIEAGGKSARLGLTTGAPLFDLALPHPAAAHPAFPEPLGDGLAYVIFTSGSTGRPKGVMVRHAALASFVASMAEAPGCGPDDVLVSVTTVSFDIFGLELYLPLATGAAMVLADRETAGDPWRLARLLDGAEATIFQATPATWRLLLEAGWNGRPALKALVGGEGLLVELAEKLSAKVGQIWNLYGPTETTVWSSRLEVPREVAASGDTFVALGEAVAATRLEIADRYGNPAPLGVAGELLIGGAGLAAGYLGQPAMTAERFLPDARSGEPGARVYRTGDLVRRRPADGRLEFLGRIDNQVKIRGYRIELGEIENQLLRLPGIAQAAVIVRGGADPRLDAFVLRQPGAAGGAADWRDALSARLPAYMVPAIYTELAAFPRTPSGKVDYRALAQVETAAGEAGGKIAPRNELEAQVAAIFAELLGQADLGIEADFFALGGHSLLATRLVARLREATGVELPLRQVFEASSIEGVSRLLAAATPEEAGPPLERGEEPEGPLSFGQQRLWFLQRFDPGSTAYNMPWSVEIEGRVDPDLLSAALQRVIGRHELLRTTYPEREGVASQLIGKVPETPLSVVQLSAENLEAELLAQSRRTFDLQHGPALRATLYRLAEEHFVFLLDCHHITADGWSFGVIWKDICAAYRALLAGTDGIGTPAPALRYLDFARWQRQLLQGETLERKLSFWRGRLAGSAPLALPIDFKRPATFSYRGAHHTFSLGEELSRQLRETAKRHGATLYMTLLAGLGALLHRWSGQDRFNLGTPTAGRSRVEFDAMVGLFVNTLVVPLDLANRPSFAELLGRVRGTVLDAFAHQDVPFERLAAELEPERDPSRNPLFQVGFQVVDSGFAPEPWPEGTVRQLRPELETTKFDLDFHLLDRGELLTGTLVYSSDLFRPETIERLLEAWRELLLAALGAPDRKIDHLPAMSPADARQVARLALPAAPAAGAGATVLAPIFASAARRPDHPAVFFGGQNLTYRELAENVDQLAAQLAARGIGPGKVVGVLLERSLDLPVALLAVLRSGAAYLPLDPAFPKDRLELMLELADADLLLEREGLAERLGLATAAPRFDMGEERPAAPSRAFAPPEAESLAYVIFTSGSTGRPKGVMVPHEALASMIASMAEAPGSRPEDVLVSVTTVSFDIFGLELYLPLTTGATLVLADRDTAADPWKLAELMNASGATILQATPPTWRMLLDSGWAGRPGLTALAGGEGLLTELADRLLPKVGRIFNVYGPTETTIWSSRLLVSETGAGGGEAFVALGEPIAATSLYVADRYGNAAAPGVAGELWIGGAGLARGYFGQPALTAERFLPDPFSTAPGARVYRTGDLVRRTGDGRIDFLGRIDFQVKIRGYRIELGEIESALLHLPGIAQVVVVVRGDAKSPRLEAFVVREPGAGGDSSAWREALAARLPSYMVPAVFVELPALPLTPSGKIDRKALPAAPAEGAATVAFRPPGTPAELALAQVWQEVLGRGPVGLDDNFFTLGGDSILVIQAIARVQALGWGLEPKSFFLRSNLEELAATAKTAAAPEEVVDRQVQVEGDELADALADLEGIL